MKNWKRALPALATVVVAALAALAVVLFTRGDASAEPARAETPSATTTTSDAPAPSTPAEPTSESPSAAPSSAEQPPAQSPTKAPATTPAGPAPKPKATEVVVTVAYHGWSWIDDIAQVGGLVEGIEESGGTCTLTMTSGARSVTGTAPATTGEKGTVVCEAVTVPGAELTAGMWQAVLSYSGAGAAGSSAAVDIEVVK